MFEKIYKGLLGAALLSFAIYLVTRMQFLLVSALPFSFWMRSCDASTTSAITSSHGKKNSAAAAGFCGEILDRSK